jgi:hypothetical protein
LRNRAKIPVRQRDGVKLVALADRGLGGKGSAATVHLRVGVALVSALIALFALAFASSAAAITQRPYKESFGAAAQPTVGWANVIAVEQGTGDVLVGDREAQTIARYHADGTAAPFTALGTNIIDGMEANGKPCSEEPASCDKTPENGIDLVSFGVKPAIAIDESGGPANGDIYLTQPATKLVNIFAASGEYLGQLKGPGINLFSAVGGVAVGATGTVYVGNGNSITKFVPNADPVRDTDAVGSLALQGPPEALAMGSGPSAGSIFAAIQEGSRSWAEQLNDETGQVEFKFGEEAGTGGALVVDPFTHNVLFMPATVPIEWETSAGSQPVRVGSVRPHELSARIQSMAASANGEVILGENAIPSTISLYGPPAVVPAVFAEPASGVTGTKATLTGMVEPSGVEVSECSFEYGPTMAYGTKVACEGPTSPANEAHLVHIHLSGLNPNGKTYHYRLVAKNVNGIEESADRTFETAATVETEEAASLGTESATLRGILRPEGLEYSNCRFEYGLSTSAQLEHSVPCSPPPSVIEPDFAPHAVSAAIGGLQADASYRYRLTATNSEGTVSGKGVTFSTNGQPVITEIRALNADQSSVRIEANIDPRGVPTRYFIEWGPNGSYGTRVPAGAFSPSVGAGNSPVSVGAELTGLSAGTSYHYRFVATNTFGTTTSEDTVFETLNSCGLPEGRCFELVSPRDAGPLDLPGYFAGSVELHFQASRRPGALAYVSEIGPRTATKGAEVLARAERGSESWMSTQLSPAFTQLNEQAGESSASSAYTTMNEELSCGVLASNQLLTDDPGTAAVVEEGGANLYRQNPNGSFTAITPRPPENPEELTEGVLNIFTVEAISENCSKIVFGTSYRYPGVPSAEFGVYPLYEWEDGGLRSISYVPGPGGKEVLVPAIMGDGDGGFNYDYNGVSANGSRVFFTSERLFSPNPAEVPGTGIFVREGGQTTRDVSLSETSVPDNRPKFEFASTDGSRVYFTAVAGLTSESSSEGRDLYEYNLETEHLSDLSPSDEEGGAEAAGFIGASADGSRVYFVATGQLAPGEGKSLAENKADGTYSVYGEEGGRAEYVGVIKQAELSHAIIGPSQTSRVSSDGRYVLFESTANVTGYDSGNGSSEAYLYDAAAKGPRTVCVSCRPDGASSVSPPGISQTRIASNGSLQNNAVSAPRALVVRNGRPIVFFGSFDALAPGAEEGEGNVYEWAGGQVFLIAAEPPGVASVNGEELTRFVGASENGTDLYFGASQTLSWEDGDGRVSVYDARVGGGFPPPSPPPIPCSPTVEGSCSGPVAVAPPAVPGASSSTFNGPGNAKAKKQKKHKKKHGKHNKQKKKQGKKKSKSKKVNGKGRRSGK